MPGQVSPYAWLLPDGFGAQNWRPRNLGSSPGTRCGWNLRKIDRKFRWENYGETMNDGFFFRRIDSWLTDGNLIGTCENYEDIVMSWSSMEGEKERERLVENRWFKLAKLVEVRRNKKVNLLRFRQVCRELVYNKISSMQLFFFPSAPQPLEQRSRRQWRWRPCRCWSYFWAALWLGPWPQWTWGVYRQNPPNGHVWMGKRDDIWWYT